MLKPIGNNDTHPAAAALLEENDNANMCIIGIMHNKAAIVRITYMIILLAMLSMFFLTTSIRFPP
jgi:hypothetical protein